MGQQPVEERHEGAEQEEAKMPKRFAGYLQTTCQRDMHIYKTAQEWNSREA
jgi:hypothetical protein